MARKFICSNKDTVVETKHGKLRGFCLDGIYTFYGIHYAEADRFQMPREPESWEGIMDALSYGFACPLMSQDTPEMELLVPHRYWVMDEHCQNLNIWTPSLDPDAKKPVMVWLHGGGFTAGSAIEQAAYEGDHLSQYGDVVVVSVNHRLNILGYLDLSAYGEKYANSANAGNADLVAALQWIHENISAFGGDPENVTLFGQSGGGEKVICLMNTPAADGLFHKGIVESGVIDVGQKNVADGKPLVDAMLKELGLEKAQVEALETLPYAQLVEAYQNVVPQIVETGGYLGCWPAPNEWYPGHPLYAGFTEHARTIPVLVGSVLGEFCFEQGVQDKDTLTENAIMQLLKEKYGEHTEELAQQFQAAYPGKNLSDLLYVDQFFRVPTTKFIEKRAEQAQAPTYAYMFTYDFPIDGGKVAWHCSEIPFVFHNTDRVAVCNVAGETDRLEEQICSAFVNFAKHGTPAVSTLPEWEPCVLGDEATMILDTECVLRHNHDHELLDMLAECGGVKMNMVDTILSSEDESKPVVRH